MLSDIATLIVIAVTVSGALFSAVFGWLDSGEAFVGRKFASSILHAVLAAAIIAVGYYNTIEVINAWYLFFAFLGGAGIDVLGNRTEGLIISKAKTASAIVTTPPT